MFNERSRVLLHTTRPFTQYNAAKGEENKLSYTENFFERGTDDCRAVGVVGRCAAVDVVRSTACNPTHGTQQEIGSLGQGAVILQRHKQPLMSVNGEHMYGSLIQRSTDVQNY